MPATLAAASVVLSKPADEDGEDLFARAFPRLPV
jgi:hypothetical protein